MIPTPDQMSNLKDRLEKLDWLQIGSELDASGYALTPPILTSTECDQLIRLYSQPQVFRSRVVMERHNFGRGEYQYFAAPLPPLVADLRQAFYPPLAAIANRWMERMEESTTYSSTLARFLNVCREAGQTRPTPLLLRYETGDYNCLHQDLYGTIAFPLQAASVLNQYGRDYTGGEFLLAEQRPRAQTRGEAITIEQGQFILFPNRYRPLHGTRRDYRVNMRHGVSRLKSGTRYCLGLIFHDAK